MWAGGGWEKRRSITKRCSHTIDVVSYALEVSVNSVTCMFVVHF